MRGKASRRGLVRLGEGVVDVLSVGVGCFLIGWRPVQGPVRFTNRVGVTVCLDVWVSPGARVYCAHGACGPEFRDGSGYVWSVGRGEVRVVRWVESLGRISIFVQVAGFK